MIDSSTIAAWVAFIVAILALFVTLAQAIQQYVATAQNMRKCDKSVWGPMPGHHGRRIWTWNQLRFRVVFDMPNIFIPTEYWEIPGPSRLFPAERIVGLGDSFGREMSSVYDEELNLRECSEASWVSFTRQISHVCPNAIRFGLIMSDADRWPADLAVVPMQVSLRDIIVLGLMTGMDIMVANNSSRFLEMSGPAGFISSSEHPLLGLLIRFSAFSRAPRSFYKGLRSGELSRSWLARVQGVATVAQRAYTFEQRDYHKKLVGNWRIADRRGIQYIEEDKETKVPIRLVFEDLKGMKHEVSIDDCTSWEDMIKTLDEAAIAKSPFIVIGPEGRKVAPKGWEKLIKVVRQGHLKVVFKIAQGDYVATEAINLSTDPVMPSSSISVKPEPLSSTLYTNDAKGKGIENSEQTSNQRGEDSGDGFQPMGSPNSSKSTDNKSVSPEAGIEMRNMSRRSSKDALSTTSPQPKENKSTNTKRLLIADRPWNPQIESGSDSEDEIPSATENRRRPLAAEYKIRPRPPPSTRSESEVSSIYESEDERSYYRYPRVQVARYREPPVLPDLPFFWASQIDIELGYWATPWAVFAGPYELESLPAVIDIIFCGLEQCVKRAAPTSTASVEIAHQILYVKNVHEEIILADLRTKLRNGGHTWPPYAMNGRGGVPEPEPHMLVDFKVFDQQTEKLPPILLLESVRDHHGKRNKAAAQIINQDRTTELASLDYWLSQAAKTDSISKGRLNLIQYTPAIIDDVYTTFRHRILRLRHLDKEREGGDVRVRKLAEDISVDLREVVHSEAEHYFIWVALLRTVKVMQCIKDGPDTWAAQSIFRDDLLVYFT